MTRYTAPIILAVSGLALLAFAGLAAPSDGAFVAAFVLGLVIAALGAMLALDEMDAAARVRETLARALRTGS